MYHRLSGNVIKIGTFSFMTTRDTLLMCSETFIGPLSRLGKYSEMPYEKNSYKIFNLVTIFQVEARFRSIGRRR
jgi:hypothetical protein